VVLDRFEAANEGGAVVLSWRVPAPAQSSYRVQRTRKGHPWRSIGTATGPVEGRTYRFADEKTPYGADSLRYRLKEVRADGGQPRYSRTLTVNRRVEAPELLAPAPNPARQFVSIRYAVPDRQPVTLRVYDLLGRRVRTVVEQEQKGRHERRVDVSALPSGPYFVRLHTGGRTLTQRFTVVR
jgi:hypothetical protein